MPAYDAMCAMEDRPSQISVLPVVDDTGTVVGLVRLHDLVKSGL
jgi:arabinose-5-phosphate isomerase